MAKRKARQVRVTAVGGVEESLTRAAKASRIAGWPTVLPPRAMERIIRVLTEGDQKYGRQNMLRLSVLANSKHEGHLDHALAHILNFQKRGSLKELEHAAARMVMAIERKIADLKRSRRKLFQKKKTRRRR